MDPRVLSYLPLLSPIATIVIVVLGFFFQNRHIDLRIRELQLYIDAQFGRLEERFPH